MARAEVVLLILLAVGTAPPVWGQPEEPAEGSPEIEAADEVRLLQLGGRGFRLRRTEHFVVAYDTPDETLRALISRLEATYDSVYRFCKINTIEVEQPTGRLHVLFFDDYEVYGQYAASARFDHRGSAGFYNQGNNVASFVNVLRLPELSRLNRKIEQSQGQIERLKAARPVNRRALKATQKDLTRLVNERGRMVERTNRLAVQHETAHQVLFNAGVHVFGAQNPGWLVEGMATLFETPPSSSGAGMGATNQMRLEDFRRCLGAGEPSGRIRPEDLEVAFASGRFVRLQELVGDAQLFSRRDDPNLIHYYSEAWSLVCYLQRQKREQFAEYLRLLSRRKPGEPTTARRELADFEGVFGPLDEQFERRWAAFILGLRFKPPG